jgi:hypothetical protein
VSAIREFPVVSIILEPNKECDIYFTSLADILTANDNFPAEKVKGLTATIIELTKKDL